MVIRMVLIGESGTGKSYAGNSILGHSKFPVISRNTATTRICSSGETSRFGTKFVVVDTPGYFDGDDIDGEIKKTVQQCVELTRPGPQVFLFVFSCSSRFCENDVCVINMFKEYFGDDMYKHSVILFTHKNSKPCKGSITRFLRSSPKELRDLIELCGNRVAAIDNATPLALELDADIRKLISIVVDLVNDRNLRYLNFDSVNNNTNIISDPITSTNNVSITETDSNHTLPLHNAKASSPVSAKNHTSDETLETKPLLTCDITDVVQSNKNRDDTNIKLTDDTVLDTKSSTRKCLWYDCSDELTKQELTLLGEELCEMEKLNKQLSYEAELKSTSTEQSDIAWCKLVDDGVSMVTQFKQCLRDIFRDEVNLLSSNNKRAQSLSRRGAVRVTKH